MLPKLAVARPRIFQFSRGLDPLPLPFTKLGSPVWERVYTPTRLSRWLIGGSVTRYIYGGQAATTFGNGGDERGVGVRIGLER